MNISKKQCEHLLFAVAVVLAVFRFSYLGLKYVPYLDDYVQYSYYPQLQNNWQRVYMGGAGVLFTRPLAGLFDYLLWSKFWPNLGIAVGVISILHGLTAVFFYKAFNMCGLNVGTLFIVFYILMPVNVEATYWLSASSRIVVSMLFISLTAYFGARKNAALFFAFNFLSMWFYEQTAFLSFAVCVWVCVNKKKWWWILLPTVFAILVIVFYINLAPFGDNAHRLSQVAYCRLWQNMGVTLKSFLEVLVGVQFALLTRGFMRGFGQLAADFSLYWLISLLILAILFFILSQKISTKSTMHWDNIVLGLTFMILPIIPLFVLSGNSFNLRNIAPSILGLSIVLDKALSYIPQRYLCTIGVVVVLWFSTVAVSETVDYSYTAQQDYKLAFQIAKTVDENTILIKADISTPKYYLQNAPYGDHIISMTGSDWGLTGIVRSISKNEGVIVEKKEIQVNKSF